MNDCKRRSLMLLLALALAVSGVLHYWEYRKIKEFSDTFQIQSQIELKRTALLVLYQEVLRSAVHEIDTLRKTYPGDSSGAPDFGLPAVPEP